MLRTILLCLLIPLDFALAFGQESVTQPLEDSKPTTMFPASWLGRWQGEVESQSPAGGSMKFKMSLEIRESDSPDQVTWTILYQGEQGESERKYLLKAVDPKKGHFVIDEQNGILLDAVLINNCLSTHFSVQQQRLWSTYRLQTSDSGPEIHFELFTASEGDVTTTGGKDGVPEVQTLKTQSRQFAVLRLQKRS
ncbi:MAG: hypothetical protein MUF23_07715 [Pirellula sp.]|nr:hypothetical protein [Pirellula sp.]